MEKEIGTPGASSVLRRRYLGDDPARAALIERERGNAEVAQMIYDRRKKAGLTQKRLAELVGTTQSVISRLEDADYEGHSLTMLQRISDALDQHLSIQMRSPDPEANIINFAFREIMCALRKRKGLTVDELAKKVDADRTEIIAIERHDGYQPNPLLIGKLSEFYDVPQQKLAELAGITSNMAPAVRKRAGWFAAQSDSFAELTTEEMRTLGEFVRFLKSSP